MAERDNGLAPWGLWGSYLPDRQWGTVREDYSADGDAWRSFPHDHARRPGQPRGQPRRRPQGLRLPHRANTPTHSFMRGLYKYPQARFPYGQLVEENGRRGRDQPE
jgi:hypothetical protein